MIHRRAKLTNAEQEGYDAYLAGTPLKDNLYHWSRIKHYDWISGWQAGEGIDRVKQDLSEDDDEANTRSD